ncbi:hypothetical protein F5Y08DRAFT_322275 [Xylaria arbuscula]|nr:hypothetical protein F5Y08DRAFT_322275 [Xylaria arbuscula]
MLNSLCRPNQLIHLFIFIDPTYTHQPTLAHQIQRSKHLTMRAAAVPLIMASSASVIISARADDDTLISPQNFIPPNPNTPFPPSWPPGKPPPPWYHEHVSIIVETIYHESDSAAAPTNTTIVVPVGPVYRNPSALASVSTLYLLDNAAVTCIPYLSAMPTGPHGHPFTVGHPAVLSESGSGAPVTVGNIVCTHAGQ